MSQQYDLIIIGGGQAGLAAGYHAHQKNLNYLILEAGSSVGNTWRDRYDSLTLFTPRAYSSLPGLPLEGDKEGYPTKDEIADYLQKYAQHFQLNVQLNEFVRQLTKAAGIFTVTTATAMYKATNIIVATGPFQTPRIPSWATPTSEVTQLHSSAYKNLSQIKGEKVLVIGGGNSGAQIAEEIAKDHKVDLAVNTKLRFMPAKIFGKSLFWWLDKIGALNAPTNSFKAKKLRQRGDPVIGTSLKALLKSGAVTIRAEAVDMNDGVVTFADGTNGQYSTIIYSTGYTLDYGWLNIPQALDEKQMPIQKEGASQAVDGLYYLGLGWLRSRNSALVGGVGKDAEFIVSKITISL